MSGSLFVDGDAMAGKTKEHARLHKEEKSGPFKPSERLCQYCDKPFMGRSTCVTCPDEACQAQRHRDELDRLNEKLRKRRAEASAHPCVVCGATVHAKAMYCKNPACQRVKNTAKQKRWAQKPEVKAHLREYRLARASNPEIQARLREYQREYQRAKRTEAKKAQKPD